MTITEFSESRGLKTQTVSIYIKRHPEEFEGHIKTEGKAKELDEVALELLEAQYPLPQPIMVVEDKETRKQLEAAKDRIIELQGQLLDARAQLADAQQKALLLESTERELDSKTEALDQALAEVKWLKSRSLLDRILNKGISD